MKLNYRNLNFTYDRHEDIDGDECYYCGHYADTIDHCPPISLCTFYPKYARIVVKSCRSCNATLGANPYPTLLSRVEYLLKRYQKKYKKYLAMPDWSEDEIESLQGSLKIFVENERNKVETSNNRILFLEARANELKERI